jgi:hypothetical protein
MLTASRGRTTMTLIITAYSQRDFLFNMKACRKEEIHRPDMKNIRTNTKYDINGTKNIIKIGRPWLMLNVNIMEFVGPVASKTLFRDINRTHTNMSSPTPP